MTIQEFSDQFDILYSAVTDGNSTIDEYQKSTYLTKAQYQILREYFELPSGPNSTTGFDGSAKRQIDFSALLRTKKVTPQKVNVTQSPYPTLNLYLVSLGKTEELSENQATDPYDSQIMFPVQEMATVTTNSNSNAKLLQVIPITHQELRTILSKPYGQPLKRQAWRLFTVQERVSEYQYINTDGSTESDIFYQDLYIIAHHGETLDSYTITYVKRPQPIVLLDLSDTALTIEGQNTPHGCELDPLLHNEILERAVTLAKTASANTTTTLLNHERAKSKQE